MNTKEAKTLVETTRTQLVTAIRLLLAKNNVEVLDFNQIYKDFESNDLYQECDVMSEMLHSYLGDVYVGDDIIHSTTFNKIWVDLDADSNCYYVMTTQEDFCGGDEYEDEREDRVDYLLAIYELISEFFDTFKAVKPRVQYELIDKDED